MNFVKCTNETYFEHASEKQSLEEDAHIYCLSEESKAAAHVMGCFDCPKHSTLFIFMEPCKQGESLPVGESCMSPTEVDEYLEGHNINVKMLTNFVDYENIEQPVQNVVHLIHSRLDDFQMVSLEFQMRLYTLHLLDSIF